MNTNELIIQYQNTHDPEALKQLIKQFFINNQNEQYSNYKNFFPYQINQNNFFENYVQQIKIRKNNKY